MIIIMRWWSSATTCSVSDVKRGCSHDGGQRFNCHKRWIPSMSAGPSGSVWIMFVLGLFLLLSAVLGKVDGAGEGEKASGGPEILGDDAVRVRVESPLKLVCQGDYPLHWRVTLPVDDRFTFEYNTTIPTTENSSSRPYTTTLLVSSVHSTDVGLYSCAYNESTSAPQDDSVYVFVDDEKNPLVKAEESVLSAPVGQSFIIPCKPTSPQVNITITRNPDGKINLTKSGYDPRVGLRMVMTSGIGSYVDCQGQIGDVVQHNIWWLITSSTPVVFKLPHVYDPQDGIIQEGDNFTLDCSTSEEKHTFYSLTWTEPERVIESGRVNITLLKIGPSDKKAFRTRITVYNARKEDSGRYVCKVWDVGSSKNVTLLIKVLDKNYRFLNVTTIATDIQETKRRDAKWVINVISLPRAIEYLWLKDGKEIGRTSSDSKYAIEQKGTQFTLKIFSVSFNDAGKYTFTTKFKNDNDHQKRLDLSLTVVGPPDVEFWDKGLRDYYQLEQNYSLTCSASGFPFPNISWFFLEAPYSEISDARVKVNCSGRGMVSLKARNTTQKETKLLSFLSFSPKKSGMLVCSAINLKGITCTSKLIRIIDLPVDREFSVVSPSLIIDQDENVNITCALAKQSKLATSISPSSLRWRKFDEDRQLQEVNVDNATVSVIDVETEWSWQKTLRFSRVNPSYNGTYVCDTREGVNESVEVNVVEMMAPMITVTNLNGSDITVKEGDATVKLYCNASGIPSPTIVWKRDGLEPHEWSPDIKYKILDGGQVLDFEYIRSFASGKYECIATNRNGTSKAFMAIEVEEKGLSIFIIIFFLFCFAILLVCSLYCLKNHYDKKKWKIYLDEEQYREFKDGAIESINPELGIGDQANLLPYDNKWEFPKDRLHLGKLLGWGAFGQVVKAEAVGILQHEALTAVAVKMVKTSADESHIKALRSELKIMVHLGRHVNVVNLLGAVTANLVKKKELLLIVEYCKYGSLLSYMHKHRHTFINQLDPLRDAIDSSFSRQMSRSSGQSETLMMPPRPLNYASLIFTDNENSRPASNGYRTLEEISPHHTIHEEEEDQDQLSPSFPHMSPHHQLHHFHNSNGGGSLGTRPYHPHHSRLHSSGGVMGDRNSAGDYYPNESMCTDMSYISAAPTNTYCDTAGRRRSSSSSGWMDGQGPQYYRGDYQHLDVRPIRSVDLLGWAFQIARGMEYLASRKVLHGDLAARNVLLAENNVVKICDFGLAKEMYKDYKYKKKSEGVLLPVKWMAIESIYYGVFSTKSDAWSFGVVLWELFTMGKTPYPGMEADERFYKMLTDGYRMEKPILAPSSIYDLMTECWCSEPSDRPSFSNLVDRIGDLMEEGHRQQYVDLNVPYDKMNHEWMAAGNEDYLSKMSGPEFVSDSARPSPDRQYENNGVPSSPLAYNGGYLVPNTPLGANIPCPTTSLGANTNPSSPNAITDYQNLNEPRGHILASNAGYIFMNAHPPSDTPNGSYVRCDIPNSSGGLVPNTSDGASGVTYTVVNSIPHPVESNKMVAGVSNASYVPSHLFPSAVNPPSPEVAMNGLSHSNHAQNPYNNGDNFHQRFIKGRRRKNDSGVGSIDSTNLESPRTSPSPEGGGVRDGGGETEEEEEPPSPPSDSDTQTPRDDDRVPHKKLINMNGRDYNNGFAIPTQHNLTYVTHSTPTHS